MKQWEKWKVRSSFTKREVSNVLFTKDWNRPETHNDVSNALLPLRHVQYCIQDVHENSGPALFTSKKTGIVVDTSGMNNVTLDVTLASHKRARIEWLAYIWDMHQEKPTRWYVGFQKKVVMYKMIDWFYNDTSTNSNAFYTLPHWQY